jgi:hypothetical protein
MPGRVKAIMNRITDVGIAALMWFACASATAALPPPTPEQEQAAAVEKAEADAEAEKQKHQLAASMDAIAARWRENAKVNGWPMHPPTPVTTKEALDAPAMQSGSSGQPGGKLGSAARHAQIRSEKHGTAAPSADVKRGSGDAK